MQNPQIKKHKNPIKSNAIELTCNDSPFLYQLVIQLLILLAE